MQPVRRCPITRQTADQWPVAILFSARLSLGLIILGSQMYQQTLVGLAASMFEQDFWNVRIILEPRRGCVGGQVCWTPQIARRIGCACKVERYRSLCLEGIQLSTL